MQHHWSLDTIHLENAWLTIGSFDGVHRGHQAIIRQLTAGAHDGEIHRGGGIHRDAGIHRGDEIHNLSAPAVVLTFHPHPVVVLGKGQVFFYLTTPAERAVLLSELGVDVVVTHPFNPQVAATPAREFLLKLKKHLGLAHLFVGPDFAFGHNREGNIPYLRQASQEFGFTLHIVPPITNGGEQISSSKIRQALSEGQVEQVAQFLGRAYQIGGEVVRGDGRGKTIGIPTANLSLLPERALPKVGVYACRAHIGNETWGAVANIGMRPTFESQPVPARVEAHLLNLDRNLYGEYMHLDFIARLRDEKRFPTVEALVAQIQEDIQRGKELLIADG